MILYTLDLFINDRSCSKGLLAEMQCRNGNLALEADLGENVPCKIENNMLWVAGRPVPYIQKKEVTGYHVQLELERAAFSILLTDISRKQTLLVCEAPDHLWERFQRKQPITIEDLEYEHM